MVANPEKFQIMFLGVDDNADISFTLDNNTIFGSNSVKLLGIRIDHKLSFSSHIEEVCKQASQKTKALLRIRSYLTFRQASILVQAYILSCFFYCPILWMFCSKKCFHLCNKVHYRALCAMYFRYDLNLEEILKLNGSFSIHTKQLQVFVTEIFKSVHKLNPEFMWDLFEKKEIQYNLRSQNLLKLPNTRTRCFGLNSILFRASVLWNSLPNQFKCCVNLQKFKQKIKSWDGSQCTCFNCRSF